MEHKWTSMINITLDREEYVEMLTSWLMRKHNLKIEGGFVTYLRPDKGGTYESGGIEVVWAEETMTPSGGPSYGPGQCYKCGRTRGSHHTMDCQSSGCDGR